MTFSPHERKSSHESDRISGERIEKSAENWTSQTVKEVPGALFRIEKKKNKIIEKKKNKE